MPFLTLGFLVCVALGLAIAGLRIWRSKPIPAFLALACSLGLAVLTITSIWPALTDDTHTAELKRTREQLAEAQRSAVAADRDRAAAHADLAAQRDKLRLAENQHHAALDRIEREITDVQRRYRDRSGDIVLDAPRRETASLARAEQIAADVEDLKHLKPRPQPVVRVEPAPQREDITRDLARLRDKLATTIKTDAYDVEPFPARELVGGRQGKYYVVDIKNATNGIRYFFDGGKYVLRTGTAEFRGSLNRFVGDVLGKMEGHVRHDLFVRGSADNKPYEGRMDPAYEFSEVRYLKSIGADRYASQTAEMKLERGVYRNSDLPNLRAAFMRDLVASTYPIKPPVILEGSVTPKTDDRDRNVELILFVDW